MVVLHCIMREAAFVMLPSLELRELQEPTVLLFSYGSPLQLCSNVLQFAVSEKPPVLDSFAKLRAKIEMMEQLLEVWHRHRCNTQSFRLH